MLKKEEEGTKSKLALLAIIAVVVLSAWMYLDNPGNKIGREDREAVLNELKEVAFPDADRFIKKNNEFAESDKAIVNIFREGSPENSSWINKNEENLNREFEKATAIITEMKSYNVSEESKKRIKLFEELLNARKEYFSIIKQLSKEDNAANQLKLAEIRDKQEEILRELNKKNN